LRQKGYSSAEIGTHAGLADTALTLALDSALVRPDRLAEAAAGGPRQGVYGDPRRATAALGELGVRQIVDTSVAAIQRFTRAPR
jgi:creatinine amidohydrolase